MARLLPHINDVGLHCGAIFLVFLVVLPVLHALPFTACTRIWLVCLSLDVQPCSFNAHFDRPSIPCPFEGFEVFLRMHLAPSETLCISLYVVWAAISTFQVSLSLPHLAISGHIWPLLASYNLITWCHERHWDALRTCWDVLWVMSYDVLDVALQASPFTDFTLLTFAVTSPAPAGNVTWEEIQIQAVLTKGYKGNKSSGIPSEVLATSGIIWHSMLMTCVSGFGFWKSPGQNHTAFPLHLHSFQLVAHLIFLLVA